MTMDELRWHLAAIQWPILLHVDGRDVKVHSRDELLVPSKGNDICIYDGDTFEVIDVRQILNLYGGQTT